MKTGSLKEIFSVVYYLLLILSPHAFLSLTTVMSKTPRKVNEKFRISSLANISVSLLSTTTHTLLYN